MEVRANHNSKIAVAGCEAEETLLSHLADDTPERLLPIAGRAWQRQMTSG
jgi:hypothetical protein